ncbi:MAG TPA: hypothetical protein VEK84_13715 [Terriglobales bacterium]|nr:hypothetical protein [Terriglobales bacterium]
MVSRLGELADFINEDLLPLWLRDQLIARRDEILKQLKENGQGTFTFEGPNGQEISLEIKAEAPVGAGAAA